MEAHTTNHTLHDAPTYGLPTFDGDVQGKTSLLLVHLTDLDETAEVKLAQFLQPALPGENDKLHTWKPSQAVLRYIAYPGPHVDSQTNLYAVAILAYRAGWTRLIVADDLTKRQLNGVTSFGQGRLPTVVMISIDPTHASPTQCADQVRVVAKRTFGWENESAKLHHMLETIEPEEVVRPDEMYRKGMVLHDSDRRPFTPDTASLLAKENHSNATYGALSKLPSELARDILRRTGIDDTSESIELPPWIRNDDKHMNIFLFYNSTSEEIDNMQSTIQKAVHTLHKEGGGEDGEEMQVKLIAWEYHRMESRRQLWNLWDAYQKLLPDFLFAQAIYFLFEPVKYAKDTKDKDIQLGTCYHDMEFPMNISWQPLGKLIKMQHIRGLDVDERLNTESYNTIHLDHESNEVVLSPNQPFYTNPPIWWPEKGRLTWIPIFYLTNKLTDEQDKALRAEIHGRYECDNDVEKVCCFIPWKSGHKDEPDGTVEDMWEMFWHALTNTFGALGDGGSPIFCIDQQSGIDKTLIILDDQHFYPVSSDEAAAEELLKDVEEPNVRGMCYGRLPAISAHNVQVNLSIGNASLEEIMEPNGDGGEPIHVYPRPGWPGHGVLRDIDDEEDD